MVARRCVLAEMEEGEGRGDVGISLEKRIIALLNECKDLGAELTRVPKISANESNIAQVLQRDGKVVRSPELTSQLLSPGADFTKLGRSLAFGGAQRRAQRTLYLELVTEPL